MFGLDIAKSWVFLLFCLLMRSHGCRPGSIQARGENLFSVLKALASSSELQNVEQRADKTFVANSTLGARPIFFDYLSWFMVGCN